MRTGLGERVAAATAGRDRVLDAAKALALLLVVVGHSLAWHVWGGRIGNGMEVRADLAVLTWGFQVLALFFAAGAVSTAASLRRAADVPAWLAARLVRLLGPVLLYATVFTAVLLPLALVVPQAVFVGQFLAQLLWFAGVYLVIEAAAPLTSRHTGAGVLLAWLAAIVAVDLVRLTVVPAAGWLNLFLVWGWLHQVGYRLPDLRRQPVAGLLGGAAAAMGAAVVLAVPGPYSNAMISVSGDPEPSNLAPPSIVAALHGVALILLLAAAWEPAGRVLQHTRVWTPVAVFGARGMGVYLWHIPVVGTIAGAALLLGVEVAPLSLPWWLVHTATAVVAVVGGWLLAGVAARWEPRGHGRAGAGAVAVAGLLVVLLSATGFGTWFTIARLGVPASAPVLLVLLWWILSRAQRPTPAHVP